MNVALGRGFLPVTNKLLASNLATLTVPGHGFVAGNMVNVALNPPNSAFDGPRYITGVVAGSTISFTSVAANVTTIPTAGTVQHFFLPTARVRASNSATLTVTGHNYAVDDTVNVALGRPSYLVINKIRASNLATLTFNTAAHNLVIGNTVNVALNPADPAFDGARTITGIGATTITFVSGGVNVATTPTAGTVQQFFTPTVRSRNSNVATLTATGHTYAVGDSVNAALRLPSFIPSLKVRTTNVATLTFPSNHTFVAGDSVNVALYPADATMDGARTIIAAPTGTTITFTANGANVASTGTTGNVQLFFTPTNKSRTSNVATVTFASHTFQVGDVVTLAIGDAEFDGARTITAADATTISFNFEGSDVGSTPASGSATLTSSAFDGTQPITAITASTISFASTGDDFASGNIGGSAYLDSSVLDGPRIITAAPANTITFDSVGDNFVSNAIGGSTYLASSVLDGPRTITAVAAGTISFASVGANITSGPSGGTASFVSSDLDGTWPITAATATTVTFTAPGGAIGSGAICGTPLPLLIRHGWAEDPCRQPLYTHPQIANQQRGGSDDYGPHLQGWRHGDCRP